MTQLTRDDLRGMTPEQIEKAGEAGQLDALLGVDADDSDLLRRAEAEERLSADDIRSLHRLGRHDLIVAAHDGDRIGEAPEPKAVTPAPEPDPYVPIIAALSATGVINPNTESD